MSPRKIKLFIIYSLFLFAQTSHAQSTDPLGWVITTSDNICGGYYREPQLIPPGTPLPDLKKTPIQITLSEAQLLKSGRSKLLGHVEITQPGRMLTSDSAYLNRNGRTGQVTTADLIGNVRLREPGKLIIGNKAHIRLYEKSGEYYDAIYRLAIEDNLVQLPLSRDNKIMGLTARGSANLIKQLQPKLFQLVRASYTTCPPANYDWLLKAAKINLNKVTGRGTAHHAILQIKKIPVLYTPYFNFPIDRRRESGFLFPTYGSSTQGGASLNIPYYFNLAPNYDATISPVIYTKRGIQLNGEFRYLTNKINGIFMAGILPEDNAFRSFQRTAATEFNTNPALPKLLDSHLDRYFFSWQHSQTFSPQWSGTANYSKVSDDYYFQDFTVVPPLTAINQLAQQASITYQSEWWNFQSQVQTYQTLHPVNQPATANQYSRLPYFSLNGMVPNEPTGLVFTLNSEWVRLMRSLNPGEMFPSTTGSPTQGIRIFAQPGVSLPLRVPAAYFTPSLYLQSTQYNISDPTDKFPTNLTRSVPILNVDTGVYFDRTINIFNSDYQQTLEPRAFYLYVPFHPQTNFPVFDTGSQPFSYDQLFRLNRFSGIDRIGDANQVSLAVTTRFLEQETGQEKLRGSVGRIYYFRNRQVMLCTTPGCVDPLFTVGAISPTESASPLAGELSYQLSSEWNATANMAYDPSTDSTTTANINFQYQPTPNHILNLGYNFVQFGDSSVGLVPNISPTDGRNNLSQTTISFTVPIRQNWRTFASWNYNLSHERTQTFFYGLEYESCCWAARMVAGQTYTSLDGNNNPVYNKQIYLQLQLKGLGNIGNTDTSGVLANAIPGYHDTFGKNI